MALRGSTAPGAGAAGAGVECGGAEKKGRVRAEGKVGGWGGGGVNVCVEGGGGGLLGANLDGLVTEELLVHALDGQVGRLETVEGHKAKALGHARVGVAHHLFQEMEKS